MTAEGDVARVVDVMGEFCPRPVMEIARAIKEIELGEVVLLLATDPGVRLDMPAWCKAMGHELVSIAPAGEAVEVRVRRLK
ncbi:MAG: sulfurtransferase TusA family protein [Myxococcota bacterium]